MFRHLLKKFQASTKTKKNNGSAWAHFDLLGTSFGLFLNLFGTFRTDGEPAFFVTFHWTFGDFWKNGPVAGQPRHNPRACTWRDLGRLFLIKKRLFIIKQQLFFSKQCKKISCCCCFCSVTRKIVSYGIQRFAQCENHNDLVYCRAAVQRWLF